MKEYRERQGVLVDPEKRRTYCDVPAARHWKKLGQALKCAQCGGGDRVDPLGQCARP